MHYYLKNQTSAKNDPIYKKIAQQMRRYPDQRISNLYTIEDISAIVKDGYALLVVSYKQIHLLSWYSLMLINSKR